jgi:hypothetical protein
MEKPLQDDTTEPTEYRLPWHKPEVTLLTVTVDTRVNEGSNIDHEGGDDLSPSDVRLKRDIQDITGALDAVLGLKGVTFSYDVDKHPSLGLNSGPRIGFIAQDLEKVYPELVTTRNDGFKMVNYAQLVPVLVEAIKEQQKTIASLEAKVHDFEAKLSPNQKN